MSDIDTQARARRIREHALRMVHRANASHIGTGLSMTDILGIQLEMSIEPLYNNEMPYLEMLGYLAGMGFTLASVEPGFGDPVSGRMLQMDGIFFRAGG